MKVHGDVKPPNYLIEPAIDQPGMCVVHLYENSVETDDGWEYDEYRLELPNSGGLDVDVPAMMDVYLAAAKAKEEAKNPPSIEQIRADVDYIAVMQGVDL